MKQIKTNKFCDTLISIKTCFPLKEETITIINLWALMMRKKTEMFSSLQQLTQQLSKTYGLKAGIHVSGYGNMVAIDFRFRAIDFSWIEDPHYPSEVLTMIQQILFAPILDEEGLEEAKYSLKNRLLRQHDDPHSFVVNEALKQIETDHTIRISLQGDIDQMENITLDQIQDFYQSFIKAKKHIYIVGNVPERIVSYLEELDSPSFANYRKERLNEEKAFISSTQREISQSAIAQVYQTRQMIGEKLFPALQVANSILGQSPSSLLFTNIREKHSYCYSISSSLLRFDGALLITTGTQKENIQPLLKLIDEQIKIMQEGKYSDTLLDIAKKDILDAYKAIEDNPLSLIEQAFIDDLLERSLTLKERKAQTQLVSKEDIRLVAKKWSLVSQKILEGILDE